MVILAAAATVIASQAVISGAFSLTQQAAQIGYLPRLRIDHTSEERVGQIYVPWINWALCVAVLALVFTFRTSTALAYAYGVAVTGTITITTLLLLLHRPQPVEEAAVARPARRRRADRPSTCCSSPPTSPSCRTAPGCRSPSASWCSPSSPPGRRAASWSAASARTTRDRCASSSTSCTRRKPPLPRVPGTAIFLNRGKETTPLAMRANVEHNHVLHDHVLILAIETLPVPHVARRATGWRSTTSATRTTGSTTSPPASATWTRPTSPRCCRSIRAAGQEGTRWPAARSPTSCPPSRSAAGTRPGMSRVAQAPVRRHRPADGRRRRVLPAPPREHRHHGLPHRTLS